MLLIPMRPLARLYDDDRLAISFELFPPKTDAGVQAMLTNVRRLMDYSPAYFTCTYGAGGSSQSRTLDVIRRVKRETGLPIASHLTCVGSTREDLEAYLNDAREAGTDYIVALRGDPPKGESEFRAVDGGLRYANELVELIRRRDDGYGIAVAGYPETHQEAPDAATDLVNLKRKVDAGADIVITQLFYDNDDFYRFRDRCVEAGIDLPIVPGILPVTRFAQAEKIAGMCKSVIPDSLRDAMLGCTTEEDEFAAGVEHARKQTLDLLENNVPGIHFYVLNKSAAAMELLRQCDGLQSALA